MKTSIIVFHCSIMKINQISRLVNGMVAKQIDIDGDSDSEKKRKKSVEIIIQRGQSDVEFIEKFSIDMQKYYLHWKKL